MERTLSIDILDHHPIAHIRLGGFMAQLEVYKLKSQIEGLLKDGYRFLIFDLSQVTFIDSAGIGAMVQLRGECAKAGGQLVLVQSKAPHVVQSLQVSALNRLLDILETPEAALAHLRQKHGLADPTASILDEDHMTELIQQVAVLSARLRQVEERLAVLERNAEPK